MPQHPRSRSAVLLATCLALLSHAAGAQQVLTLDAENSLLLPEVGAVTTFEDGVLEVLTLLPRHGGGEAPKVDLERGDAVRMINGERVRDLASARALYEKVPVGEMVKMAVQRGERRFLVSFAKQDPAALAESGLVIRRMAVGPEGAGDVQPVLGLGILAADKEGVVRVAQLLPIGGENPLAEGDLLRRAAGKELHTAAELAELVDGIEVGATVELVIERGGEERTVRLEKREVQGTIRLRKEEP